MERHFSNEDYLFLENRYRKTEAVYESLIRLDGYHDSALEEILDFILQKAIELTDSKVGYIYFYEEISQTLDLYSWSKDAMPYGPKTQCQLSETGLLGEAIRQRQPLILTQSYRENDHDKFIMIEGKHLNVPIFQNNEIIALIGVANKESEYNDFDIKYLKLLMTEGLGKIQRFEFQNRVNENARKFRATFEQAAMGIFHATLDGVIIDVNQKFIEITGYDFETLKACKLEALSFDIDIEYENKLLTRLLTKQVDSYSIEKRIIHGSGRLLWVKISYSNMLGDSNEPIQLIGVIEDISKKKATDNQIIQLNNQLKRTVSEQIVELEMFFNTALDMLGIIDFDGYFRKLSPTWTKVLGWTEVELKESKITDFVHPDDLADTIESFTQLKNGKELRGFENRLKCQDGTYKWLDWNSYGDTTHQTIITAVRDATAQKEFESLLIDAKNKAEEANRAKSEFLANMSHEIRTPLNAVIGFSELLTKLITDDKQKGYIESIYASGKNLLTLINDILDLSKIEAGKMKVVYEPVNVLDIIQEIENIFQSTIEKKGLQFQINYDNDLPDMLMIDEMRLRQVLLNIVGNAVKFTETGSIQIALTCSPASLDRYHLYIDIKDTGIGIIEHEQEAIFQAFVQQSGQNNRKYGGTGLGLSICKRLVEMMNGEIAVKSTYGVGSTFTIKLFNIEVVDAHKISHRLKNIVDETIFFKSGTVLIVDDIPSNRFLLSEMLVRANLNVIVATNGKEAIELLLHHTVNLVLMDIKMPIMDGFTATQWINSNPSTQHIPVIAMSASIPHYNQKDILSKGFANFLRKPISTLDLYQIIAQYLELEQTSQPNKEQIPIKNEASFTLNEDVFASDLEPIFNKLNKGVMMKDVSELYNSLQQYSTYFNSSRYEMMLEELKIASEHFDIMKIKILVKSLLQFVQLNIYKTNTEETQL